MKFAIKIRETVENIRIALAASIAIFLLDVWTTLNLSAPSVTIGI